MGIFEAEIRGHTGEEDILTSRVFGILEILDRTQFLLPILKQCGISLEQDSKPENISFSYWEKMGKRTPDVILKDKSTLIFIECKLDAPLDIHQLTEEYEDGMKARKDFWLIAITRDWVEPLQIQQAKEILMKKKNGVKEPHIQWVNWQTIYVILKKNAKNGNQTEKKLIEALLGLLEAKKLRGFDKFDEKLLDDVASVCYPGWTEFLDECSAFLETLKSRLESKNIVVDEPSTDPEFKPKWVGIMAWDEKWVKNDKNQYFAASFYLFPRSKSLELIAGYFLDFSDEETGRELRKAFSQKVIEESYTLIKRLKDKKRKYSLLRRSGSEESHEIVPSEKLSKELFEETLKNFTEIGFGCNFTEDKTELLDRMEECLVGIRDIIIENKLYFPECAKKMPARD